MNNLKSRCEELLSYDPYTGVFTRKITRGSASAGSVAGHVRRDGYMQICIDGKDHLSHHLAFLVTYGYLPEVLDHVNGLRTDNRIANLRPAHQK